MVASDFKLIDPQMSWQSDVIIAADVQKGQDAYTIDILKMPEH